MDSSVRRPLAVSAAYSSVSTVDGVESDDVDKRSVRQRLTDRARLCPRTSIAALVAVPLLLLLSLLGFVLLRGSSEGVVLPQLWDPTRYRATADASCRAAAEHTMPSIEEAELAANRTRHPLWSTLFSTGEEELLRARHDSVLALADCGVVNGTERGLWSLGPDNAPRFDLEQCRLRRPSPCEVQRCLSSQSILFVGDSLTRYNYLSLIYFLSHGSWPDLLGGRPEQPSPVVQPEHASWAHFYQSSNATYGGREHCSCFRNASLTTERRHFYDSRSDITARFFYYPVNASLQRSFQEVADEWRHGSTEAGSGSRRERYTYTVHSHQPKLCSDFAHDSCYYPAGAPYRPVSVLVANVGIWQFGRTADPHFFERIRAALPAGLPLRAIWKLATPRDDGSETKAGATDIAARVFSSAGAVRWQLMDLFSLVNQTGAHRAYVDAWHFRPFVYQEMNVLLLNMLCDEQWQPVRQSSAGTGAAESEG